MCDCFHLAFPNWHAASSGTGAGRRLRAPEPGTEDDSTCDEPSQFTERERPRPQGSSPVEEFPETEKYTDSDKECEAEHDPHKRGSGKKTKKSGLGSMFEKRSTPKMSKLKEVHSPESGVIVKTAKDGCAEGLVYGGGGKEGIFIKGVVPESPASKNLKLKEGDQILSATVYFDNVSYEDAIQILEHAQAYKVKLCLKRKPDITETEPTIESDVIPEEDVYAPEMREQGKTKRRGEARISWPKFPSFGKGRKSRFTRSHSSSEADEQRKLELSPTTSDTESPIKSQDALKGKKKHKMKLNIRTKRGRISSSEDQDTDAPTTAQIVSPECLESPSGETPQVYMTEDLKVVEDLRCKQNDQTLTEPQPVQHKVELITIDSTLKTEDLTLALAGQESPSGIKSPDGKKKKKERSELKMKILGKDKSHKKDAKAKSSPKRLKTLGASIEIADQPETEKSGVIPSLELHSSESPAKSVTTKMEMSVPKVDLEISDVALIQKSPQKGEEITKKGKDKKQKQETKTGPTFKLPKIGFSDIDTEETIPKMNVNVEECTTRIEQLTTDGTEVREDPYERLSKSSLSRTKLPKREDIEIPGMEDMSTGTTAKGIKQPKAVFTGHYEEIHVDPVQMSIDVDSVKEAVSKLPGYKLPKVDTSGMPIPEEITVIDANAQRISVKTPTKTKHEAHFSRFDTTASPEISKTTVKLPKITADLTSEELLMATQVEFKQREKEYRTKSKQGDKEFDKRENIIIPGKESTQEVTILQTQGTEGIKSDSESITTLKSRKAKISMPSFGITKPDIKIPDIGIYLPKQNISEQTCDNVKGERTIFLQEAEMSKTETMNKTGGVVSDVKIPEIDGIEYIDSVDSSPAKMDGGIRLAGLDVDLDAASPQADISFPEIKSEVKDAEAKEHTFKLPKFGAVTPNISINVPEADNNINIDGAEETTLERQGKAGKFRMPNLGISMPKVKGPKIDVGVSKQDADVKLPEAKVEAGLTDIPDVDVTLGNIEVSIPEQKMHIKPWQAEGELDGEGGKLKKFGIKMPKVKGPELDFNLSKKDIDVTLPEAKEAKVKRPGVEHTEPSIEVEVKAPESAVNQQDVDGSPSKFKMPTFKSPTFGVGTPNISVVYDMDKDVKIDGANIEGSSIDMKATGTDHEGKGSKFKMPHLGFSMPKVKGPQINLSSSKKDDKDVTLPEATAEVKLPEGHKIDASFGKAEVLIPEAKVEVKKPELKIKPLKTDIELEGEGGKFQMPKFGITMPKVKGPEIHFGLSKKDGEVTLPESKAEVKVPDAPKVDVSLGKADVSLSKGTEVKLPEVELKEPSAKVEIKAPEIKVSTKGTEGSPSKFKMPTFKLPKFGAGTPNISVEVADMDKDVKIDGGDINIPDKGSTVKIAAPSVDIEDPSTDMKSTGTEQDGRGGKFKMPHLSFSMPKVKGPKMDLSLSKKDVDVTLPEVKSDVKLGKVDVSIPEARMEVKKPEMEMQFLETEGELDGHGEKYKMPKVGIKMPKGPEFDLSLSKKDVDITLPQTKVEVKLPDAPKIDVSLGKADVTILEAKAKVEKSELEIKPWQTEVEVEESKLKMPKFGMSMPKVKEPEFHLGFSKKDADVTLPEAKAVVNLPDVELQEPSAKVGIKAPEIEVAAKDTEGSPSKFKMPTFSFSMPKVKGHDIDLSLSKKDTDITLPGTKAETRLPEAPKVDASLGQADILISGAKLEVKKPEVEIKPLKTDIELEGEGGKFQMPKFGITMPKVKGPEIHFGLSKKDGEVTLPEAKVEVKPSDVELNKPSGQVEVTGSQGEGKESKFKVPKFGISLPKVQGSEIDLSFSKKDVDVKLPKAKAEANLPDVELKEPSAKVEVKAPEIGAQLSSVKGSPSKYKLPTFKFPKFGAATPDVSVEVPDIDKDIKIDGADMHISVPHKDVDVPEVKAEVNLPEIEVKKPTGGVEVDAKLKKPRFSMPKFSFSKQSVKVPEVDASLQDTDVAIPEGKVEVKVDMKPECEAEVDGQGSKFKLPKFGITLPKVTGPEIDLSLSKKDVTLPEAKAEVQLPDVKIKQPSANVEIKAPEIEGQTGNVEGSPSTLKMPTFTLPKFGATTPKVSVEIPDAEKDIKIEGGTVDVTAPSTGTDDLAIDVKVKGSEFEGSGREFKMPKFGIAMPKVKGPEIDFSLSKKDIDVTLPDAEAEIKLPNVEAKDPKVEIKAPEIKVTTKDKEESPSKFKMPTFKLPKFGGGTPSATVEDMDKDIKFDGAEITIPEEILTVHIAEPSIDTEGPSITIKTTGTEHEGKGSKFKLPSLGFTGPQIKRPDIDLSLSKKEVDVTLPEAKAEVKLPDVKLKEPSAEVEIKAPEIKVATKGTEGSPSKFKMPTFKLPKFGVSTPSATIEVPDKDIKIDGVDIKIPEEVLAVDIAAPSIDIKGPSIDVKTTGTEQEGKGSKFKLPSLGFTGPQIKQPHIDLSLSKKEVDVTLPEAKAEVKLPDVKLKEPSAEVEIKAPEIKVATKGTEGSPSKFKMPTFKFPKFGGGTPSATIEVPDRDVKIDGADIKIPEEVLAVDIAAPSIDIKGPSIDVKTTGTEQEGKGSKFKLPSLGFTGPQIKQPHIDLSLSKKEADVTLPEAKAEVKLPDVKLKEPSAEVEIKAPEIKVATKGTEGSPSKFKMPSFKLPKFGVSTPSATIEVPDRDVKIDGADIKIPEEVLAVDIAAPSIDIKGPSIDVKTTGTEQEGKGSKFKLPSLGFTGPQIKRPDIDLSLSKKEVDVTLPEAKAEVKLPDVKLKEPSAEVEIKAPEIKVATKGTEGSPSKFKMPSFKLPKFGVGTPSATIEVPDRDVKIDGADIKIPEEVLAVDIAAPSIDIKGPSIDVKTTGTEQEGKGSKVKLPSLGFTGPQIKRPDIDLSLSKKEVDVTLPEAKAEVKLPDIKLKEPSAEVEIKAPEIKVATKGTEGSPSKFKMPSFKLPKFGVSTPSATIEVPDKDIKIDGADIKISEEVLAVDIAAPSIDIKGPSIDVKTTGTEQEGKGSKFKLPSLGFTGPQIKRPDIDLSLSKKEVDVTLPEAKAEVKLPDIKLKEPSAEIEIKAPEIKVATKDKEESPSKFKMPTFKLPKFGVGTPSATVEDMDKDIKFDGADITIPEEILTVHIAEPSIDTEGPSITIKTTGTEHEGKGSKFKLPSLGFTGPQIKRPDIDLSLSKKEVDVTLPEAKAEVKLPDVKLKEPSAEVEIKAPEIKVATKGTEGSPSKFKMPSFKLPKFGVSTPSATVEVPDRDVKIDGADIKIPEEVLAVDIAAPSIDIKGPSIDVNTTGTEQEGKGSKFKLPSLGFTGPQIKRPDIDLSLSKKEVDVTLPEAKAEVKLPDVKLKEPSAEVEIKAPEIKVATKGTEGSPSKFKMPTFKLPKFGFSTPSATVEVPDRDVKIDGADIKIPEEVLAVDIAAPSIDIKGPSIDVKTTGTEQEGKGSKVKLPSLGFTGPRIKRPDIDLSLSKKEVDVTLPEAKAEVKLPDVKLKEPSAEVEIKAPEIKVATKGTEGSPSKFKMPTFKLPKFGVGTPSATIEVPDRDVKIDGADIKIPEEVLAVDIAAPSIDIKGPSIDVKTTGTEQEGKGSKVKLPSLSFTGPQIKRPDIDLSLSKKEVDVTLPEAKTEVKLPDVKLKELSTEVEIKSPEINVSTKGTEGSPSKFNMPTFKLPKLGATTPQVSLEVSDVDKDIKVYGADLNLPEVKAEVKLPGVEIKEPVGLISVSQSPMTEGDATLKKTSWTMPRFSFSKTSVKAPEADVNLDVPKVDATLPDAKTDVRIQDIDIKESSGISVEGAPAIDLDAKLKKPRFSLPKFSFSKQSSKEFEVDVSLPDVDVSLPEGNVKVKQPEVELQKPGGDVESERQESKFKLPKFGISMPKVTGPEIDLSLSKKDVDVQLPEAKGEVQLPGVKIKQPPATGEIKSPTFTLPKFGAATPKVSVEIPDVDKDIKIEGGTVDFTAPRIDTEGLSVDVKAKGSELEGSGSKFKMPKFGISMPKVRGPEIDLSLSKKDVDVQLPEAKGEVQLPGVKIKQPPATGEIKSPTFTLPKFGAATPKVSVEIPDVDKDIKIEGSTVDFTAPRIDTEGLSVDVKAKGSELEGSGSKFKMPKFGISMPTVKGPEIDMSLSKKDVDVTLPEAKTDVRIQDIDIKESSGISVEGAPAIDLDAKLKKPRFSLPKFSFSKQSSKEFEVDVSLPDVDVSLPEGNVKVKQPEVELQKPGGDVESERQESKFKLPKFGISMPKVTGPEIDLSLSKKDVDVQLPEAKGEVQLPGVKIKQPPATGEIKSPTFTLPKFGAATPKVSVEIPDVDKDIKIEGSTVDFTAPRIDTEGLSVDVKAKGSELEGSGSKFKMPKFGISMPKVRGPEIDMSLSKTDVDVTLPEAKAEVKLPNVEVKETESAISVPDAPTVEVEAKVKQPNWTFPKFSFSRTSGKAPDVDVNFETTKVDVTSPEVKVDVQGPPGAISMEEPSAIELDSSVKKTKFSLPKFSFSKSSVKEPEVSAEIPHVDVSLPEGEVIVKQPEMKIKAPELEADGQGGKFKLPKFGIALPKAKGPEDNLNASQKDEGIALPGVKAEVKLPEIEVKDSSASVEMKTSETEVKSKDVGGSPSKFKMPTLKMPKFGGASYDVTVEAPDDNKEGETDGAKLQKDVTFNIKGPSVDIKTEVSKAAITDSETTETDSAVLGSPSKFKLSSFKMPKLSFSRPNPEGEHVPVDTECKEDQLKMQVEQKAETKSPKMTFTSFGEILKSIDVEFNVPSPEENLETSKEVHKTDETSGKEAKETKQDAIKSPEKTGWFKFPKFGLSSPSEPAKIPEKDEQKDEKSPAGETVDEEISSTCSVQSSDAFADVSSALTSEHAGLSLSSPTKVTVKYSDPNAATGLGEIHSNIITSTTRTELISVEPNKPEKITILSSGVSSSSEDTLRLDSGKIHVITSNIQATPEAHHAKLLTAVQVQSAGGLPLESEANETASWTIDDSQSSKRTVFERHLVRETSSERSESKETVVITKQITRMFDSSEPISGETASSIQRLRDSVHSEKMKFFDGADE